MPLFSLLSISVQQKRKMRKRPYYFIDVQDDYFLDEKRRIADSRLLLIAMSF